MSKRPATLAPEAVERTTDPVYSPGSNQVEVVNLLGSNQVGTVGPQANGIFLYSGNLQALGKVMACQIRTYDELLAACTRLTTISVDGLPIQLDPGLIIRLKSRCINREFGPYLKEQIIRLLCGDIGY